LGDKSKEWDGNSQTTRLKREEGGFTGKEKNTRNDFRPSGERTLKLPSQRSQG